MKSNDALREEKPIIIDSKQKTGTPTSSPQRSQARSSGRGLYITAIVLGIIIVVLLALYIFLSLTIKKPAHGIIIPINMIAKQITDLIT